MKKAVAIGSVVLVVAVVAVIAALRLTQQPTGVGDGARGGGTRPRLEQQTSSDGIVTVVVTPRGVPEQKTDWKFDVALETHTVDLSEDLERVSVLVDDGGKEHKPTAWAGDPPGGHHRQGTLTFRAISPVPAAMELRIEIAGKPRTLEWRLP